MNAQEAVAIRTCLIEMGHPQPATPLKTDNMTAKGIIAGTIKQKRSKAMDMRFYWLKERYDQGQFDIHWEPGKHNLADYPTKHHPASHHKQVRPIYLNCEDTSPSTMQGCIEILTARDRAREAKRQGQTRHHSTAFIANIGNIRKQSFSELKQKRTALADLNTTNSNIKQTWNKMWRVKSPGSPHYLFRTFL